MNSSVNNNSNCDPSSSKYNKTNNSNFVSFLNTEGIIQNYISKKKQ